MPYSNNLLIFEWLFLSLPNSDLKALLSFLFLDLEDLEKIVDRELKKLKEFERANTAKK